MKRVQYEMPAAEFIRTTIEYHVAKKINGLSSTELTSQLVRPELFSESHSADCVRQYFIHSTQQPAVLSGSQPSIIEQETILKLASLLFEELCYKYLKKQQTPPYALVYIADQQHHRASFFLISKTMFTNLKNDHNRHRKSNMTVFMYKLKRYSEQQNRSL